MIAVFADPHAHAEALEAVMSAADAAGAEALWSLGDMVGGGPDPEVVVARTRERCAVALRGSRAKGEGREEWCGEEDSNFHGVAPASPSSWCVYQFRHRRTRARIITKAIGRAQRRREVSRDPRITGLRVEGDGPGGQRRAPRARVRAGSRRPLPGALE